MQVPVPICLNCKHLLNDDLKLFHCTAFPDGIPWQITTSEFDHHFPHPDDNGIQFEPDTRKVPQE